MKPVVAVLAVLALMLVPSAAEADPLGRSESDRDDDLKGPQVHVVYAIPAGGEDRELDTNGTLANSVAGFQQWLGGQTGGRSLRMDTSGGSLDITFFRLSLTEEQMLEVEEEERAIVREIEHQLRQAGLVKPGKIYAVYYDGASHDKCGGSAWPPVVAGQVAAMYLRGDPDPPGGTVCAQDPNATYWQFAMLHDTLHAAGFVARCAPHHNAVHRGHVTGPSNDLMYGRADDNAPNWDLTNLELDVGSDDYYEHREERCLDLADSPYLTPRLPAGNLTANPSFELDTDGWATRQGTIARVPAPGAPHGDFAAKVSGSGPAFISDCPDGIGCSVQSTTAGTRYVASAHVRAVGVRALNSPARIMLREYTTNGSLVKQWVGPTVWLTSSFARLTVTGHAVANGHVIGVRVEQPPAYPGGEFLADLITIEEGP